MKHLPLQLRDTRSSQKAAELRSSERKHVIYHTGQKERVVCLWSSRLATVEFSVTGAWSHLLISAMLGTGINHKQTAVL